VGALLPHEIEVWDASGSSYVWVRVPQIPAGPAFERIWMYYECTDLGPANPTAVWDSSHAGVWHLHENTLDSTSSFAHGMSAGTTDVPGRIGRARGFDGNDDSIDVATGPALRAVGDVTLSLWARYDTLGGGAYSNGLAGFAGFADMPAENYHYSLFLNSDGSLGAFWEYGAGSDVAVASSSAGPTGAATWRHYAVTRDSATRTVRFYTDGVRLGAAVGYPWNPAGGSSSAFSIGRDPCCAQGYFDGAIDEVRVETVVRSDEWMRVQHASVSDALVTYGPPERK
jgi:hypothetical protein